MTTLLEPFKQSQIRPDADTHQEPVISRKDFDSAIISSTELAGMTIQPRKCLIGHWFREGDLGFIFGKRGLGKTWLAVTAARHLAEGEQLWEWAVQKSKVLYVDGEMPLEAIKDRDESLTEVETEDLLFLNHETFFKATGKPLSLSDPLQQNWLEDYCEENGIRVLFLDNLSCLFSGMRENTADDWEKVLPWLLSFRRKKISVVIVAHAGRSGNHMRGTSRREDAAFWAIGLSDSIKGREEKKDGARFLTSFTKDRNSINGDETRPLDWHFYKAADGKTQVAIYPADNKEIVFQLIDDGLESCTDIAQDIGLSKGAVSKIAKKLEREERIMIAAGGKYKVKTGKP